VSALLATGAVHHHLVQRHERTRIGIVLETGEAREVHHHCLLIGFGADAINPYLAFEALWQARRDGLLSGKKYDDDDKIVAAYRKGVAKGLLKVMAKMGISTLQSYKGAQIFEAVGLADEVIERCFKGTVSRVSGVGFEVLAQELIRRHELVFRCCRITVKCTGVPKVIITCGILRRSPNCRWRHALMTKMLTGVLHNGLMSTIRANAHCVV